MKKSIIVSLATMAAAAMISAPALAATGTACQHIQAAGGQAYGGCEICEADPVRFRGYLCKVIAVNPDFDNFILMDCTGNTWIYEGIEDVQPGDFYTVAVDTRNTARLEDDKIISITYERPDLFF